MNPCELLNSRSGSLLPLKISWMECPEPAPGLQSWKCYRFNKAQLVMAFQMIIYCNWSKLENVCKALRGLWCKIPDHWTMGTRSFLREIYFEDKVRWVVKIRMPYEISGKSGGDDMSVERYNTERIR